MNENNLEILVVDDGLENLDAARKYFEGIEAVNVDYAKDYSEASKLIESKKYHGALLDLYFPEETNSGSKELIRSDLPKWKDKFNDSDSVYLNLLEEIESDDESNQPLGFLLGRELKDNGVPLIFVSTAEYGHGSNDNPFYALRTLAQGVYDLGNEFEHNGIREAIAEDVYQKVVSNGNKNIDELKRDIFKVDTCKRTPDLASNFEEYSKYITMPSWISNLSNVDTVNHAIKGGVLKPIKGVKTYERAFEALKENFGGDE